MIRLGKICVVLAALVALHASSSAQFAKGENYAGVHLGLSGVGSTFSFGADYERGVTDKLGPGEIGVGALVDYWSYNFGFFGATGFSYKYISIAAMGNYHLFVDDRKWDPFAGLTLGYYIVSVSTPAGTYSGLEGSRIYLGLQIGARYFFTPTIAGQVRLGFGPYIIAVGVDFKF